LANDPIPNIRFNVAKSLGIIMGVLKGSEVKTVDEAVKPVLLKMQNDGDIDVRYFAKRSLAAN
jgi:serine/threonine-protein phosphatase 2A regulatory subunit A